MRQFWLALGAWLMTLMAVESPGWAQGGRASVGIMQMEDLAQSGGADTFSTMIETAIASTGRFRVIERERLGRLLQEQGRARSGTVTSRNRGRVGGFEGVDYLVYGTITSIGARTRTNIGTALLGGLLSGLAGRGGNTHCANQEATIEIDIRITDAATGEIKRVTRVSETQRVAATCSGRAEINTPVLMRAAAERIAGTLVTSIYPIQVAAVQGDGTIILNYGDGTLQADTFYTVFSVGQPIRDPTTGNVIGNDETRLGHVRITEVTPTMSRAAMVGTAFAAPPPVGAVLRPATEEDIRAIRRAPRPRRERQRQ